MTKFEYLCVDLRSTNEPPCMVDIMNDLGEKEWELVTMLVDPDNNGTTMVFKKERR